MPVDSPQQSRRSLLAMLCLDEAWLAAANAKNIADLRALFTLRGLGRAPPLRDVVTTDSAVLALPALPSGYRADGHHVKHALLEADAQAHVNGSLLSQFVDGSVQRPVARDSSQQSRDLLSKLGLDEAWLADARAKNLADLQALCTLGQFRSGAPTPSCIIASLPAPPPQEPVRDKRTAPTATVPRAPRGHPSSKAGARSTTSASAPSKGVLVYPRRKLLSAYTGSGGSTVHRSEIPLRLASTGAPLYIKLETIKPFMHLPQKLAAAHLDISLSSLKYVCRRLGIAKWTRPACVPVATTHHVTDHVTSGPRLHAASKFLPDNGEI